MEFDLTEFIYLLKCELELFKQDKTLLVENKKKYETLQNNLNKINNYLLSNYAYRIQDHLHWPYKTTYSQLIEDFLNLKIDVEEFIDQFSSIFTKIINEPWVADNIKDIEFKQKQRHFSALISDIHLSCTQFSDSSNLNIQTEEQFRDCIQDFFSKIQKYSEI